MKKSIMFLLILCIGALFVLSGCSYIEKEAVGQRVSNLNVLSSVEAEELKQNYNFEPVGEIIYVLNEDGSETNTQNYQLTPKNGIGEPKGGAVDCDRSGCTHGTCRTGCLPLGAKCTSCFCNKYNGEECGKCSCDEKVAASA